MSARTAVAADLGKHLSAEIQHLMDRHARIAEAGGASTAEWSAAVMIAVDRVILQGLAGIIIQADRSNRGDLLDAAMLKLANTFFSRRADLLKVAEITDALVGR